MMVGESNQHVFLIQIDASNFAEFEMSEFEISRFDCIIIIIRRQNMQRKNENCSFYLRLFIEIHERCNTVNIPYDELCIYDRSYYATTGKHKTAVQAKSHYTSKFIKAHTSATTS